MRGIITPAIQYPGVELKTEESKNPIPIPQNMCLELSVNHARWGSETLVTNEWGRAMSPHRLEHYFREARNAVKGLPEGFRFHDLRHYFASLLIAQGLDVKVVQKSLRHSSAKTTLDTYGHMWPDKEARHGPLLLASLRNGSIRGRRRTHERLAIKGEKAGPQVVKPGAGLSVS
ncbi:tyrosine-type recombinase/integrase [Paenarthrobacter aurescens]|uniref:tyrosine-type recombinase/integrase n=1 Tax=Paenarthrobacter aurescens TaxID=43663 RepID=UPI0021C1DD17|nr:tyrosine-type recombinase/integrase [Paenarthrobacter aurescens]MCT9871761.1 tyrosine-type recombinase/integrase [Paenarthrobacter aurescens]